MVCSLCYIGLPTIWRGPPPSLSETGTYIYICSLAILHDLTQCNQTGVEILVFEAGFGLAAAGAAPRNARKPSFSCSKPYHLDPFRPFRAHAHAVRPLSRGLHHKCWCKEGFKAVRGYCEKDEAPQPPTTTTQPGEGLAVATGEPPAMQTSCAWGEEQCGGAQWTGASCCEAGYYCDGSMCAKARSNLLLETVR